jgi:integrase/recombinase XerC
VETKKHEGSSQGSVTRRKDSESESGAVTIIDGLHDFIRYMKDERQASPLTLDAYERELLRFATQLEARGHSLVLVDVTAEDIRDHMHRLIDRHLAKATVRRALYAIGSFFSWCVRWGLVPANPVARVTIPRRERLREVRALSKRERAVLIAAADRLAKGSRWALNQQAPMLVRLMLKTGLRRGEVLGLSWRDVDIERGEVFVRHGKGDKSRRVPVEDADLRARLRALRARRGIRDDAGEVAIFIGTTGRRMGPSSISRLFRRLLVAAGLDKMGITPHSLRHTFGSVLCARGVPVPYVKDLLGHEDIGSTMIYVHSTPVALRQAVRKLRE